jgi:hypothetical protein
MSRGILFLRLKTDHLSPKDRVHNSSDNALLYEKAELFSTTRDHKRKFESLEGLPVFKDLYGHPVLRRDGGHVGVVLSPARGRLHEVRKAAK